ncbi:helix-turn-helix domain-containing protein [Amedibacterium intestinale]|uniref:HTH cro/C1-type domain-containing protein n=1 Tax=Amedibacterium intestinale TaxID=2583452 RepID=A0A6N4THR9_9FIRM|nr:helix-turn-helix transcriptional regulator [Amedibacterium intestinale]BBK22756.1 hypothetical protein Aargi30884_16590 [Amedibacterium intestinale]
MLIKVNVQNLKIYRKKSGLTRHALSLKAGLGKNAIFQIESGQFNKCSSVRIKAIADTLGVDYKKLIVEEEKI